MTTSRSAALELGPPDEPPPRRRSGGYRGLPRRLLYTALSVPLGVLFFIVTLFSVAISAALSVTLVGSVIFLLTFAVSRANTRIERARARWILSQHVDEPPRNPVRGGPIARTRIRLTDPQSWRDVRFLLAGLPLSALSLLTIFAFFFLPARGLYFPIRAWHDPAFYRIAWGGPTYLGACLVHSGPGLLMLVFGPRVFTALTNFQVRLARRMTGGGQAAPSYSAT